MKKSHTIILIIAYSVIILFSADWFWMACRPDGIAQLLLVIFTIPYLAILICSIFLAIRGMFRKPIRPLALLCTALLLPFLAGKAGVAVHQMAFNHLKPVMEEYVMRLPKEPHFLNSARGEISVPDNLRGWIYAIHSRRKDPDLEVSFFYGSGFPVKHSAWVYYEGKAGPDKEFWPHQRKMMGFWYQCSD
jgi:hypothetical protein